MAFDRAATLRHAEKSLRQGKLDAAIAAYASVLEQQPTDWNTANTLGDLYVRAGQSERAVEQFVRSADQLIAEGFLAKAGAVYKKVLKLKPDDERSLLRAGELSARQGLFVDARAYLTPIADRRAARGDAAGATDLRIRIDTLDPNDYERRIAAARLRADAGDTVRAVRDLQDIAHALTNKRRPADALAAIDVAAQLAPGDGEVRTQLVHTAVAAGDFARARAVATTVEELRMLADALDANGRGDEAIDTLRLVARMTPADMNLALRVARAFMARGDVDAAAEFLTPDVARADPPLLLAAAEAQLRTGHVDAGMASVRLYLEQEAEGREQIALLGCRLADAAPDVGFRTLETATDAAAARSDWPWAVAALQEFSRRAPAYIPALMRLVEVCVDGGLDTALDDAQVRLTDAYLGSGAGAEARTLAEDLVEREPWEIANVDRLRRALSLLGEGDPDAVIAARLSAPSANMEAVADLPVGAAADEEPELVIVEIDEDHETVRHGGDDEDAFGEVDLGEIANTPDLVGARFDTADVDLSLALNAMAPIKAPDLEGVFQQLREEVTKRSSIEAAEAEYQQALALQRDGDLDGSVPLLRAAARAPSVRFAAASLLARTFRQQGQTAEAIEWFEHATDAEPEQSSALHVVMYELAETLEAANEPARALAVWLELQSDAGVFRDVAARIDRLVKMKAQG